MEFEWMMARRLLLAVVLGGLVGLEREYRSKEAGLRTHFLVCLGSALFTIVSQYGFMGVSAGLASAWGEGFEVRIDPARVAAQVVTGIGFIGAGTIVLHRRSVVGLTTAAGLWTTAAIGMAVGGGLHAVAIFATLLTLAGFELLLELSHRIGHLKREMRVVFLTTGAEEAKNAMENLRSEGRSVTFYSATKVADRIRITVSLAVPERAVDVGALLNELQQLPGVEIESVE
jgi:putative Mg2+ transporter-C (MgtC) family protein